MHNLASRTRKLLLLSSLFFYFFIFYHALILPLPTPLPREESARGLRGVKRGGRGEREGEGGGGVRQYHSSNIFHPLRPSSEPLLVGIVWILSRTWHFAEDRRGRRIIGAPSSVLGSSTRRNLSYLSPLSASAAGGWTSSPGCTFPAPLHCLSIAEIIWLISCYLVILFYFALIWW